MYKFYVTHANEIDIPRIIRENPRTQAFLITVPSTGERNNVLLISERLLGTLRKVNFRPTIEQVKELDGPRKSFPYLEYYGIEFSPYSTKDERIPGWMWMWVPNSQKRLISDILAQAQAMLDARLEVHVKHMFPRKPRRSRPHRP